MRGLRWRPKPGSGSKAQRSCGCSLRSYGNANCARSYTDGSMQLFSPECMRCGTACRHSVAAKRGNRVTGYTGSRISAHWCLVSMRRWPQCWPTCASAIRDVSITGCWANINAPDAAHRTHAHPNNFLSGVYYVQVQDGADSINFHDPRAQTAIIRPAVTELTAYNTDQVVLTVNTGTLIVFPAWLPHSVDTNQSELPRISIGFNVMFAEFAKTMGQPLWGEQ